jgi:hypothetical protein
LKGSPVANLNNPEPKKRKWEAKAGADRLPSLCKRMLRNIIILQEEAMLLETRYFQNVWWNSQNTF